MMQALALKFDFMLQTINEVRKGCYKVELEECSRQVNQHNWNEHFEGSPSTGETYSRVLNFFIIKR